MVLGNVMDIFLRVKVMAGELTKLQAAQQRISAFAASAEESLVDVGTKTKKVTAETNEAGNVVRKTTTDFTGFRMEMLSVMFAGMALTSIFGRMLSQMPGLSAATTALGSAMKVILTPLSAYLVPAIMKLASVLMNLPKPVRIVLGVLILMGVVMGVVVTAVAMGVMTIGALTTGAAALVSTIGVVVAALGALTTVFILVSEYTEGWTRVLVGVIAVIAAVAAAIAGAPIIFAAAIGAILAVLWGWRDEIASIFMAAGEEVDNLITYFTEDIPNGIKDFIQQAKDILTDGSRTLVQKAKDMGSLIVEGIVKGVKNAPDAIIRAIDAITPGLPISAIIGAASAAGGIARRGIERVNDFIVTDSGRVLKPSGKDTIIGTKNPEALGSSGGGNQISISVDSPRIDSDYDVDRMIERVKEDVESELRGESML